MLRDVSNPNKFRKANSIMKSGKKLSMFLSLVMIVSILVTVLAPTVSATNGDAPFISRYDKELNTDYSKFFSNAITQRLPEGIKDDEEISLIIQMKEKTLLEAYDASGSDLSFAEFCQTQDAQDIICNIDTGCEKLISALKAKNLDYEIGERYDTLFSGFEITECQRMGYTICQRTNPYKSPQKRTICNTQIPVTV